MSSESPEGESTTEVDKPTPNEVSDSLTGWEEMAVAEAFGHSIEWMQKNDHELLIIRALAAVLRSREQAGTKVGNHWRDVMALPQTEVQGMFAEEPDEAQPDDPDSEGGKGASSNGHAPVSSPNSASLPESHLASTTT